MAQEALGQAQESITELCRFGQGNLGQGQVLQVPWKSSQNLYRQH